ncbi:MAG: sigma-54-dependent Fis family transcriptional regulator [Flavobacteriales bacterium]|nr:sigma-54-dependent Fis family transcriptional regulator [Flavobacteriales bacterium]
MNLQQIKQRFGITGNSPRLNYALETAVKVAPTDITVYIQGESGVGKESFSKIIHSLSNRKHGPFIAINCGAIPEGTINSELFGHEKGAFTGAIDNRKGYFETVNGGTIFLDEVGELPLETQSRLLRLLENGEFIKVGSSKVQKTDVRIITATNKDLFKETQSGKFREDLYYRLSTLPIKVPPLRERPGDILLLFKRFAFDLAEKYHSPELELTPEAEELMIKYNWPGNIRQLKNVVEQLAVLEQNNEISAMVLRNYLPEHQTNLPALASSMRPEGGHGDFSERDIFYKVLFDMKNDMSDLKKIVMELLKNSSSKDEILEGNESLIRRVLSESGDDAPTEIVISQPGRDDHEAEEEEHHYVIEPEDSVNLEENLSLEKKEEELIRKALLKNNGKRKKAARDLGISERTLYRKIKQYELE